MNLPRLDQQTMQTIVDRCAPLVAGAEETEPRMPVRVMQDEAYVVAEVVEDHFATVTIDGKERLGLETLVPTGQVSADISSQLREFSTALGKVQSDYVTLIEELNNAPIERGEHIVSEMRAALSFLLEDGDDPTGEAQLDQLREEYDAGSSQSVLASSLEGFSALGMRHKDALTALAGFDEQLLDEAVQVAAELRQRLADRVSGESETKRKQLMSLRNRLITGLTDRMRAARRAVRYVFRDYPQITRKVASEYDRERRRRTARKNKISENPVSGVTNEDVTQIPDGKVG